ncbi:MAG: homocysteine S-methyltransferase family protein, partial [Oscillospiraceae bacterium]
MGINFLNDKFLFLDGAMGTMLQKSGLKLGERPETLSITNADLICDIHKQYINAGANIIYANTFGANDLKLKDNEYSLNEVITASINCAKNAVKGTDTQVALDVGPLGEMLKPAGSLSFDDAYNEFKKVVIAGENAGANLVVFETMTDIYEVKAAVLATKENTKLPIFVSMSFEENGRTFQGCPVEAMALVLEGLAVDAVGINCSLGPQEIFPLAKRLCD